MTIETSGDKLLDLLRQAITLWAMVNAPKVPIAYHYPYNSIIRTLNQHGEDGGE